MAAPPTYPYLAVEELGAEDHYGEHYYPHLIRSIVLRGLSTCSLHKLR